MRNQRGGGLCAAECPYRRLYEGSQASLSDMAGKQADALNRVARLRGAIVSNLKQTFPLEFGQAESQLSRRMSSVDDEVLLAYLSGFLALPGRRTAAAVVEPSGAADLRDELEALGVRVPAGSDLTAWAAAVAEFAQSAAATASTAATAATSAAIAEPVPASDAEPAPATAPKRSRTGARGLLDGAAATGYQASSTSSGRSVSTGPAVPTAPAMPEDPADARSAGARLEDVPADTDFAGVDPGADDDIPWGVEPPPETDGNPMAGPGGLSSIFDEDLGSGTGVPVGANLDALFNEGGDLNDLFGDDDSAFDPAFDSVDPDQLVDALFDAAPDVAVPASQPVPAPTAAPTAEPTAEPGAEQAPGLEAEAFPTPPTTGGLASQQPSAPRKTSTPTPAADDPAAGTNGGRQRSAMRPELFPATQVPKGKPTRRTSKTSRVSAAPPDPRGLDVPIAEGATGADLTDDMFDKLVASVCIPRPVFISDLVAQVGSADLVAAWEQRCRDMGTDSPVRFITPKSRHRERGSLIVPHAPELRKAASEFTRSWWATCLDERQLRGAKLYEVAVLLHRFGESIISSRIDRDIVVLRVNQARGLVGVAVALEADLSPGGTTRTQLADAVGELLADRLTLVAILTHTAGSGTLEKLSTAVREESEARGWRPTAPVIASSTWDFAADGGSSALAVL